MVRRTVLLALIALLCAGVSGCGGDDSQTSYQDSKKMVLDMLRTDDGKRTLKEVIGDREMKAALVLDEPAVRKTIVDTLTTQQGKQLWTELIKDPDFSEKLAETMQEENEQLLKKMMKDPGYQKMMTDILKNPALQDQYLSLLRTKPFRQQIATDLQEAISGPAFQKEMSDAVSQFMKKQDQSNH
ncbi:spore germination lipoprotein GerD [Sporolactobacillus vineae]|uniref:spore germination lipoprotein GerD n=1 Tax=Sporolactobacillus vineae TaxID=444463 RepID=UPI000288C0DE|nr:spore germination lipoprotein GerD [Sporolactobacillus vineae]